MVEYVNELVLNRINMEKKDSPIAALCREEQEFIFHPPDMKEDLTFIDKIIMVFCRKRVITNPLMRMAIFLSNRKKDIDNLAPDERQQFWKYQIHLERFLALEVLAK